LGRGLPKRQLNTKEEPYTRENIVDISRVASVLFVLISFAPFGVQSITAAQDSKASHPHYAVKDLGTFGGSSSFYFSEPVVESANNRGMVVRGADTAVPDPFVPNNCLSRDCTILHAFQWRNGVLTDLGTLTGSFSSTAFWVNERGLVMGLSETGVIDPLNGIPEQVAVLWKDGEILSLGTLKGGVFSFPNAMNNRGQVIGVAQNTIRDPLSFLGFGTQSRAFLWQEGEIEDLGTLGGPDALGASVNEHRQAVGWALTNSTPNPVTNSPTQHPFLWENHIMRDLGTLGGTFAVVGALPPSPGAGGSINNRAQVIGTSNLAGDIDNLRAPNL
jgi:probable HAF family extracellular repeat protein